MSAIRAPTQLNQECRGWIEQDWFRNVRAVEQTGEPINRAKAVTHLTLGLFSGTAVRVESARSIRRILLLLPFGGQHTAQLTPSVLICLLMAICWSCATVHSAASSAAIWTRDICCDSSSGTTRKLCFGSCESAVCAPVLLFRATTARCMCTLRGVRSSTLYNISVCLSHRVDYGAWCNHKVLLCRLV